MIPGDAKTVDATAIDPAAGDAPRPPYPGLRAFRREETDLFFGREDCIVSMVDRLAATRFLAVLGSSGTGKSSLVRTGLLDGLELGLMGKAGSRWRIVDFRPGGAPLRNLARRLLETEKPDGETAPPDHEIDLLRALLARGPRSIIEWCRAGHLPKGTNLLLLVDQFEELFRYQSYAGREEAEAFVSLLLESTGSKEFPIYGTITMRSEYLGACSLIDGLSETINAGMFLTPRMTREQCREAIVGPAQVVGIDIEPALVNRLLNDLANFAPWEDSDAHEQLDRIMRRADQLPLLQYTLNRMWLRARERSNGERIVLRLADYEAIGGLSGALDAHADQIFDDLGNERRPVVEWVFRALTSGSAISEAVRQPTRFGELVAICGGDEPAVREVVNAFRAPGVNFLVPESDSVHAQLADDTFVDISHESLIRQWRKLSAWLEKEAHAAQQWRRLVERYSADEVPTGRELANLLAWRAETHPNAAWAKRYGGDYKPVTDFLDDSQRTDRRQRIVRVLLRAAAVVAIVAAPATFFYENAKNQRQLAEQKLREANYELMELQAKEARESADRLSKAFTQGIATMVFNITQKTKDADLNVALVVATESLALVRNRAEGNQTDNTIKRLLSVTLNIYGDVKMRANDVDAAGQAFNESLGIARDLAKVDPGNTLWQDDLALALVRLATAKSASADAISGTREAPASSKTPNVADQSAAIKKLIAEAHDLYEEALRIDRKLVAAEPNAVDTLANFQAHLSNYGEMLLSKNNLREDSQVYPELTRARDIYTELVDVRRQLLAPDSNDVTWMRALAAALQKLGEISRRLGDMPGAARAFAEEVDLDTKVAARMRNDTGAQQSLASSLINSGDTKARAGELAEARKLYEQAMDLIRKVLATDPDNVPKIKSLSEVLDKVGNVARQTGDQETARQTFDEELALDRKVALRDPENTQWQKDLIWSLNRVGDLQRQLKEYSNALKSFEESIEIARKLLVRDSQSVDRMQAVASMWDRIGGVKEQLNDKPAAQTAYEELLDLRRQIASRDPENNTWQKDISNALDKLGEILRQQNNTQGARRMFDEELAIDRRFALKDPDNIGWQMDLVWSLNRVGDLQRQIGDTQRQDGYLLDARENYQEVVALDRKLIEREPDSAQRYRKFAADANKLIDVMLDLQQFAEARQLYDDLFHSDLRWLKVAREQYSNSENRSTLNDLTEVLGLVSWHALLSSRPQDALVNATEALKLDNSKTWIKINLAHAHLFLGRYDEAKTIYAQLKDLPTATEGRNFSWYIKDDYRIFRRLQIGSPEMARMEQELGI